MPRSYIHLNLQERALIETQLTLGMRPGAIAVGLMRARSTITREIWRNGWRSPPELARRGRTRIAGGYRCMQADHTRSFGAPAPTNGREAASAWMANPGEGAYARAASTRFSAGLGIFTVGLRMAFQFKGVDFIHFDGLLSGDELLARDTARQFVEEQVEPIIEQCNHDGRFPRELVKPMAQLGFLGANLEGYGCAGMSNVEYGLVMQELERGDSALRSFVSVQSALVMYPIHAFGSDAQKDAWLPRLATGEALGCFGLTEPDFGSNPGGMRTRARKEGATYVLNGEKMWITSGSIADVAVIWAKVEEEGDEVRGFLVETNLPGFAATDVHGKWSLRASVTSGLSFVDVRVPASNLLPGSRGLKSPLMCLNQARHGIAWGALGAAMACYDTALKYSLLRKQFRDAPIASHQLVQEKLAWMITEITKGQLLALQVGRLKDADIAGSEHISMAKRNNVWMALECARLSRDILGASGITSDYPIMRHMMNLESVKTYEGTHDIHTLILGESVTGIPAF